jgi:deoxyribonuclease V
MKSDGLYGWKGEIIGAVLRPKTGGKPLYVSVGYMELLAESRKWRLRCCRGYRLPEPTWLTHPAAGGNI